MKQISTPKLPLDHYNTGEAFKIYLLDVGLLGAMCHLAARTVVDGDQLFIEFKGALTENYVAQSLKAAQNSSLHYWSTDTAAEVDFVLEHEGEIFPLEVKSGTSTEKKSLLAFDILSFLKKRDSYCSHLSCR